ncbi:long-chain-fatty-acid--CoA ligase [Streptacidiphilus fuscans]|uniref:Long-chain-fatty-acid--CoA ligase n=1 Tax=Streptacidiphilus fuscans TaxID=2789292 RepID=A0A931BEK2_9ACTN|nr:long-chain-fatty-acid--CoA ligase [Streptacidiphilus fuscans]MBF9072015.1 long-chain-fatty-acid--CoA ligase [Streptacidiphilus fuscans]
MYLTQALHRELQVAPERTMTVCGGRARTAREVVDRVARLAAALRGLGVEPGDRVAVLARNSDRYHEIFFGAWWTAVAVNPVNTRWSVEEIAYGLNDSGSLVLFVDDDFAGLVPALRERCPGLRTVVHCGDDAGASSCEDCEDYEDYEALIAAAEPVADLRAGGETLAALLYTGGTTGAPKGVMVSHRSLVTSTLGTQVTRAAAVPGGSQLVCAPMFHIAALLGWLTQVMVGGTAVFLPAFTPDGVWEAVERHGVTSVGLVPTMLQMLVDHPGAATADLGGLRHIGYGASSVSESLLRRAMELFPQASFTQGYGMTETAMITVLGADEHRAGGRLLRSAGRAAAHCEVRVAGPDGEELPRGQVGELLCRGDHLMLGYWNRPDETALALRDGWMHTGDAAYMDEDGYVFITDRLKDMIISGGENVYSAEVENALAQHPAVASVAVIGLPDPLWGERVHAVVVLRPDAAATEDELRRHVRSLIASYKVPRSVEFAAALPVSGAGKILKRELRDRRLRAAEATEAAEQG